MRGSCCLAAILSTVLVLAPLIGVAQDQAAEIYKPGAPVPLHEFLAEGLSKKPSIEAAQDLSVKNIPPLYVEPKMQDEGVWIKQDMSGQDDASSLIYRTFYRPSDQFPNAIVYMLLLNMKQISAKLYLGSAEPFRKESASSIEETEQSRLLAVTNALWQTRHAGKGGIILQGQVLKEMSPGVATIVVFKDETIDVVDWNDDIPLSDVRDARQLMHLIVKDGKVVTTIAKRGQFVSAEIGLGSLLNEDHPVIAVPASAPGEEPSHKLNFTSGDLWFLATRSGFGIRPDGNLVFAVGHHISTSDLAKALVLAGCVRAMHGDANPGNCVGALYFKDENGKIVRKAGLSPGQDRNTPDRYLKGSYPKDFFAFFRRPSNGN
ncbi:MAG: hypothetical protein HY913_08900 [Desulfomonile tiedjei]|nr:hypothetical protein [Desulfomonile tiedjei]